MADYFFFFGLTTNTKISEIPVNAPSPIARYRVRVIHHNSTLTTFVEEEKPFIASEWEIE